MKKILLPFAAAFTMLSCDQKTVQETTATIRNADSLYQSVQKGYKAIDSISKVSPELRKQAEAIRKKINIKNIHVKDLDSLSAVLKDATKDINISPDAVKSLDSAARALNDSKDPVAAISTISKTVEKLTKNHRSVQQAPPTTPPPGMYESDDDNAAQYAQPISKNAHLEIMVDDFSTAQNRLIERLRNSGADISSEKSTNGEGTQQLIIHAKIPAESFDEALHNAESLGSISTKSIESAGTDYDPSRKYDLTITLREDGSAQGAGQIFPQQDSVSDKSIATDADHNGLFPRSLLWWLLLPVALIGALVWYLTARNARKKHEQELQKIIEQQRILSEKINETSGKEEVVTQNVQPKKKPINNPDDYSRFMPK